MLGVGPWANVAPVNTKEPQASCCGSPVLPSSRESLRGDTRTEAPLELTPNKALDFLGHAIILFMWGRIILSAVIVVLVVVWLLAIWLDHGRPA